MSQPDGGDDDDERFIIGLRDGWAVAGDPSLGDYILAAVLAWMTDAGADHDYPIGHYKPRPFCEMFRSWKVTDLADDATIREEIQRLQDRGLLKQIRLFKRDLEYGLTVDGRERAYDMTMQIPPTEGNELVAHRFITEWVATRRDLDPGPRHQQFEVVAKQPQLLDGPIVDPTDSRKQYSPEELPSFDVISRAATSWYLDEVITSLGDAERVAAKLEQGVNFGRIEPHEVVRIPHITLVFPDCELAARTINALAKDDAFEVPAAPLDGQFGNYREHRLQEIVDEASEEGRLPVDNIAILPKNWTGPHCDDIGEPEYRMTQYL